MVRRMEDGWVRRSEASMRRGWLFLSFEVLVVVDVGA